MAAGDNPVISRAGVSTVSLGTTAMPGYTIRR